MSLVLMRCNSCTAILYTSSDSYCSACVMVCPLCGWHHREFPSIMPGDHASLTVHPAKMKKRGKAPTLLKETQLHVHSLADKGVSDVPKLKFDKEIDRDRLMAAIRAQFPRLKVRMVSTVADDEFGEKTLVFEGPWADELWEIIVEHTFYREDTTMVDKKQDIAVKEAQDFIQALFIGMKSQFSSLFDEKFEQEKKSRLDFEKSIADQFRKLGVVVKQGREDVAADKERIETALKQAESNMLEAISALEARLSKVEGLESKLAILDATVKRAKIVFE